MRGEGGEGEGEGAGGGRQDTRKSSLLPLLLTDRTYPLFYARTSSSSLVYTDYRPLAGGGFFITSVFSLSLSLVCVDQPGIILPLGNGNFGTIHRCFFLEFFVS